MSKIYVFEAENEKGETEMKYVELSDEKIDRICRRYVESRIDRNLPI